MDGPSRGGVLDATVRDLRKRLTLDMLLARNGRQSLLSQVRARTGDPFGICATECVEVGMKSMAVACTGGPLWEPAFVLPSQLPPRRSHLRSPEMHLVAAVFEDAWHCILRNLDARRGRRWHEFLDAHDWFFNDRRDWPFAFANVCELLTLDATAVRESLLKVMAENCGQRDDAGGKPAAPFDRRDGWRTPSQPPPPSDNRLREQERLDIVGWDEA